MSTRRTIEKLNEVLYSSREKIYSILGVTNNLTLLIAIGALIYSLGFDLEADETSRIFRWLEALIVIFVLDYFIRMIYSFHRWQFVSERTIESVLVFLFLIVVLGYLLRIDVPYSLFMLFGFSDFRAFYEFFIASYLMTLTIMGMARASQYLSSVKVKPATTFIASFILLILIGTFLLMMPAMTTQPGSMSFLSALFTSTSASCVTGLSVVTVASYFTFKGQLVILILLQLGGIGIVSFATFFATFLSQGVGMKQQAIIQDVLSSESLSSAKNMLKQVIILTFSIEAIGALAIYFSWSAEVNFYSPVSYSKEQIEVLQDTTQTTHTDFETGAVDLFFENDSLEENGTAESVKLDSLTVHTDVEGDGEALDILFVEHEENGVKEIEEMPLVRVNNNWGNKIYYSIFHSISAFCNAGFSLFPNGLAEKYVDTSYVFHLVIAMIIIFGSLGFSTIQDVFSPKNMRERLKMPWKKWPLGAQIAVNMTIFLTILGGIGFFFLELDHTLQDKNLFEAIVTAFFQSVTTRTAGFNTVSLALSDIAQPTYIMFLFLMFIGAAPGSTGGGIKTSTFLLLVISALASIRGKKTVEMSKRSIPPDTINRAFSIVAFAIAYNILCIFILLIVQPNISILDLFFEQISAFATVGLSTGITSSLNEYSQAILILTMYIGRVGTLTLALALSKKVVSTSYHYPTAHIMVG